jgi:hypothetical protein
VGIIPLAWIGSCDMGSMKMEISLRKPRNEKFSDSFESETVGKAVIEILWALIISFFRMVDC